MMEETKLFYDFLKARGLPVGAVRRRRGGQYIKTAPNKWKRYSTRDAAEKGRKTQEKIRGRKGKLPASGVPKKAFVLFNRRNSKPLASYIEKGRLGAYNPEAGIPKGGKMILVNARIRRVIGEAHTKKGASKLISMAGGKSIHAIAYIPKRARKPISPKQKPKRSRLPNNTRQKKEQAA